MTNPAWTAVPNAGAPGARRARARPVDSSLLVTQNIDGLHLAAGSDPDRVVEVHGDHPQRPLRALRLAGPTTEVIDRVRAGEPDPPCGVRRHPEDLDGVLRRVARRGRPGPGVHRRPRRATCCSASGTTLQVYPVAQMVPLARRRGAARWSSSTPAETPFDDDATVVRGSISESAAGAGRVSGCAAAGTRPLSE